MHINYFDLYPHTQRFVCRIKLYTYKDKLWTITCTKSFLNRQGCDLRNTSLTRWWSHASKSKIIMFLFQQTLDEWWGQNSQWYQETNPGVTKTKLWCSSTVYIFQWFTGLYQIQGVKGQFSESSFTFIWLITKYVSTLLIILFERYYLFLIRP